MYFLKTRYYDPEIGRFMTIDGIEYLAPNIINGLNLYVYCRNNPNAYIDSNGTDAILILKHSERTPFVGHAALAIQDSNGNWYLTQFAGDKVGAQISLNQMSLEAIYELYEGSSNAWANYWGKPKSARTLYLEGDYTDSYELAQKLNDMGDENGFNKQYNLIFNNCLDYVQTLLNVGNSDNALIDAYYKIDINIIPRTFFNTTKALDKVEIVVESITTTVNSVANSIKDGYKAIKRWFTKWF